MFEWNWDTFHPNQVFPNPIWFDQAPPVNSKKSSMVLKKNNLAIP